MLFTIITTTGYYFPLWFSKATQLKVDRGLTFFILSLLFPLKEALFFLLLHFIYT